MPHIDFGNNFPGIRSALAFSPLRAKQIAERGYGNHIFKEKQPI
jgi:hypothetical protein